MEQIQCNGAPMILSLAQWSAKTKQERYDRGAVSSKTALKDLVRQTDDVVEQS